MKTTTTILGSLLLAATTAFAQQNSLLPLNQVSNNPSEAAQFALLGNQPADVPKTIGDFEKNTGDGAHFQLGENSLLSENEIFVHAFPNPSNGVFTLNIPENVNVLSVEVYDFTGRLIFVDKGNVYTKPLKKDFDLSSESDGAYILIVRTMDTVMTEKIVLQH